MRATDPSRLDPYVTVALGRFARSPRILVALDFDGTLAPFEVDPAAARATPVAAGSLAELGRDDGAALALVSGRPLADLAVLAAPPPGTWLAGSHGRETGRIGPDGALLAVPTDLTPEQAERLARLTADAAAVVARHPGARIEHKPSAVGIHTRGLPAAESEAILGDAVVRLSGAGVDVLRGDHVVELRVDTATKGDALVAIRDQVGPDVPCLFAGDDVTDETALAVLAPTDVAIKVGAAPSVARYRVPDPDGLAAALRMVVQARRAAGLGM